MENNNQCNDCRLADDCNHKKMMKNVVCNFKEPVIFYRSNKSPTIDESQHPYDTMLKQMGG